jgi:hypothetical protein
MNGNPGIIRRSYDYIALFALLHVLAATGVGVYLVGSGAINREKLRGVVMVLRGEALPGVADPVTGGALPGDPVDTKEPVPVVPIRAAGFGPGGASEIPGGSTGASVQSGLREELEILRLEGERIKAELEQRLTLNNSIMLRVTTQREAFHRDREQAREDALADLRRRQDEGFEKQIAILEALSPKVAVEHLLSLPDIDEAAFILLQMDTRKARKIVETARTGQQLQKMQVILQRLRDVAPDRSTDFDRLGGR